MNNLQRKDLHLLLEENIELKGQLAQVENEMMELLYESILDVFYYSIDAVFLIRDSFFVENNLAAKELFSFRDKSEIKGKCFKDLSAQKQVGGVDADVLIEKIMLELKENRSSCFEWICQKRTGENFYAMVMFTEIYLRGQSHFYVEINDITKRKEDEKKISEMNNKLIELSRQAGMSEVATGVLHNIGNVLNSVNISTETAIQKAEEINNDSFFRIINLIKKEFPVLDQFLSQHERGKLVQQYLTALFDSNSKVSAELMGELQNVKDNVDTIKNIVSLQQSLATKGGLIETVSLIDIIENALQVNRGSIVRHEINIIKSYNENRLYLVVSDRLKILQILINLVSNAIHACSEYNEQGHNVTIRIEEQENQVLILVQDNGVGIASNNMVNIFEYGFTTKDNGHGFGLHNASLAAKEIGGDITVSSEGEGKGAIFIFSIPLKYQK